MISALTLLVAWAQPLGVGGSGPPKNLDGPPTFDVASWCGSGGGNILRQTGYIFLNFFWRRAVIPQTKKLDPPTLKTWLHPWLVGRQKEHPACKNTGWWGAGVIISVWSEVPIVCIWSSWCHCHPCTPSSLASFKSRLILPFWYRFTQVVLEKRPLNGCVCRPTLYGVSPKILQPGGFPKIFQNSWPLRILN